MPLTVANYALPGHRDDVPLILRGEYRADGFSEGVRNWHLERIPRLNFGSGTYITCPWCGKEKDFRSMQIDHIIPIQQFVRYEMQRMCLKPGFRDPDLEDTLRDTLKELHSAERNLLLCCMKCNSGGGNTIPQTATLQAAAHRVQGSILETRLNMLISTVGQIGRLPTSVLPRDPEGPFNLSQFVLLGARWNTSRRETRNRGTPYDRPSGVKAKLSTIHNVVVDMLARQRPAFTLTAQYLMAYQPTRTFINANEEGRLCFYCLGLFKKQAFQIDHINPASGRSGVPTVYSDATNLIPVCRSCNTAKGIKYLSTQWLDEQIAERQRQNLPGVEQAIVAAIPAPHGTYLDYVKARRMQILNH